MLPRFAVGPLAVILTVHCAWPGHARAEGPRVIVPEAAKTVSRAFERMRPTLELRGANIDRDHVIATLCGAGGAAPCITLRLGDPDVGCAGDVAGPWCLTFLDGAPRPEIASVVREALATNDGAPVWTKLVALQPPDRPEDRAPGAPSSATPPIAGLPPALAARFTGVLVIPPLAGAMAAGLARKRLRRWMRGATPVFVTALAAPVLATLAALAAPVGLWDALLGALSMGAAFLFVGHAAMAQRGVRLTLIASCVVSAALAEGAVRVLLPKPPAVSPAADQRFFLRPRLRDRGRATFAPNFGKEFVCAVVYDDWGFPEHDPQTLVPREFVAPPGHARRVLHIGDSMIWGAGVQPTDTFPARLGALEPESLHVNAGVPAIGPDGYLALARRWLPVLRPELVVVSLFAGNDLIELDSPYPCCEWGPLLAYDGPAPSLRCPTARGLESRSLALEWLRSTSPPPYLLRTTAAVSAFSAYATAAFLQPERHAPTIGEDVTLAHLGSIVAALRDESRTQGAELAVVVLPLRASLASPSPRATVGFQTGASMVDIARRQHVLVLDAWDLLEAESRARGVDPLFADAVHFSRAGHEIVAAWLHRNLPAATIPRDVDAGSP